MPRGVVGLLEAAHAEMSSGPPPPCGAPYPRCFDDKVPSSPSECYETCYTNNETNPSLVFHFRAPVTLTSLRVTADPDYLAQGWDVYTSRGVNGGQGWQRCLGHDLHDSSEYPDEDFVHRSCFAPNVRSVKLELHTPYPTSAGLQFTEVQPYGCGSGYLQPSATFATGAAVNRTDQHGQYCSHFADSPACLVPTGTTCFGSLETNWDTMEQSAIFCGDKGTCLALPDAPVSEHPPTSTCVCNAGYRLEHVADGHVTCVSKNA